MIKITEQNLTALFTAHKLTKDNTVFGCIGSDKTVFDCFGPICGTILKNNRYHVVGVIGKTFNATNIQEKLDYIATKYKDEYVIAIDTCLGMKSDTENNEGTICIATRGCKPGSGLGRELPTVGSMSLLYIITELPCNDKAVVQMTQFNIEETMEYCDVAEKAYKLCTLINRAMEESEKKQIIDRITKQLDERVYYKEERQIVKSLAKK